MCGWHFAIVFILLILRSDHRPLMQFYFLLNVFTRAILSELCSRLWLVLICCCSFLVRSILNVEFFALFYIRCPWQNEYLQNEYLHPMQCDLFGMRFGLLSKCNSPLMFLLIQSLGHSHFDRVTDSFTYWLTYLCFITFWWHTNSLTQVKFMLVYRSLSISECMCVTF